MRRLLIALAVLGWLAPPAHAVLPSEVLDDPALEARARAISKDLRCLVCQNQSIDDSDAELARDLRLIVRERLVEGDTDAEVNEYIVERYGDFVLLTPPFNSATFLLWTGPGIILAIAVAFAFFSYRRHSRAASVPAPDGLDANSKKRVDALLGNDTGQDGESRS